MLFETLTLERVATYCTVEIDVRLSDVGTVYNDIICDATRTRELIGAECANASDLGFDGAIRTARCVENGVCLSFDLLFCGEVDVVCGCRPVSFCLALKIDTINIRGVGMLSMIAAEKRPDAFGDINIARTAPAPALCPKIVMREGSPPKACEMCQSRSR